MQNWETLQRSRVKNILVIRLGAVAEILAVTPLMRVLRDCFPDARISFLLEEKFSDLLAGSPVIDEIIPCPSTGQKQNGSGFQPLIQTAGLGFREFWEIYRKIKKRHCEVVIDLQGDKRARLLTFLSRAEFRIGYEAQGRSSKVYTIKQEISPIKKHLVLSYLDLVRELISHGGKSLDLSLFVAQAGDQQKEPLNLREGAKKVLIHPGGERPAGVWPDEKFAQLADRLIQESKVEVILAGANTDRERVGRISQLMSGKSHLVYHSTLPQLISILKSMDIFVGNDNGPMHIAAALGKRVVALFGPSDPRVRHPWGSGHEVVWHQFPCSPCDRQDCFKGAAGCMASIEVSEVLEAVAGFLSQS